MNRGTCNACRSWDRYESDDPSALNARLGDCRFNPPPVSETILNRLMPGFGVEQTDDLELNVYEASAFPVTHEESWCGRFEPSPHTTVPDAAIVRVHAGSEHLPC